MALLLISVNGRQPALEGSFGVLQAQLGEDGIGGLF
jgi:hypothetical protein